MTPECADSPIGLITLDKNTTGKRSAGNPRVAFDEAGAGNGRHHEPRQSSTLLVGEVKPIICRSRRIRGLTLIELLVVIGIIAILASLLLPVLGKTRDLSKQIKCASNMKQVGTAWFLYSDDYNYLASYNTCAWRYELNVATEDYWWPTMLQPYVNEVPDQYNLQAHVKKDGIFWCPAWGDNSTSAWFCAFGMYMWGAGGAKLATYDYTPIFKITKLPNPSEMLLLTDSYDAPNNKSDKGYVYVSYGLAYVCRRHAGKASSLFADGHADRLSKSQFSFTWPDSMTSGLWRVK